MTPRALKVVVELKFRAVSCPGVRLPAKDDVYLSVCFMGQYRQSECLPAVFPLLVYEKMTFEKIFRYAVDPGDIAVMLEYEMLRTELVQMIPPAGEILACFEEDARSFLFPEPKLVPPLSGVDREVLMMKAPHFPGISPRLEFSTKTTITECLPDAEINIYPNTLMRPVIRRNRRHSSRPQTHGGRMSRGRIRSQSLSPLRHGNIQNLSRLSLDSAVSRPTLWRTQTSEPESARCVLIGPGAELVVRSRSLRLSPPLCSHFFTSDQVFLLSEAFLNPQKKGFISWLGLMDVQYIFCLELSGPESQTLQQYIKDSLASGFIHSSTSPLGAGFFFMEKKDKSLRPCIDYPGLNQIVVKNKYPLPCIDSVYEKLHFVKFFSKHGLHSGYHLVGGTSEDDLSFLKEHNPSDYCHSPVSSEIKQCNREHARHTRSKSISHTAWEEVHERVRGLLTTPKAVRRLIHGATDSEVIDVLTRRSISPGPL